MVQLLNAKKALMRTTPLHSLYDKVMKRSVTV